MSEHVIPPTPEKAMTPEQRFDALFKVGDEFAFHGTKARITEILDDDAVDIVILSDYTYCRFSKKEIMEWVDSTDALAGMEVRLGTRIKLGNGVIVHVEKLLLEASVMVMYPNGKLKPLVLSDGLEAIHASIIDDGVPEHVSETGEENSRKPEQNEGPKEKNEQPIIENCVFEIQKIKGKRGQIRDVWVSKRPEGSQRKTIHLDEHSKKPVAGRSYRVEILRDSEPDQPLQGKLYGRIIEDDDMADVPFADPAKIEYKKINAPVRAIEINEQEGYMIVGDVRIELAKQRGPLTPNHDRFKDVYTLDARTLEVLQFIAEAVQLGQSCLLTGETATSKTSAIEYLASLTGHEVIRLNLSGQSDTSELIGKYVPNDGRLQIQFEQMLKHPEQLSEQSREILKDLQAEIRQSGVYRGLNKWESQQIAKFEAIPVVEWRWQDGKVPQAMKTGAWLILDEVNLADPAVRERLNPVLEVPPSIVLTEHEGERIIAMSKADEERHRQGDLADAHPVKQGFHIFGTQNPAEYGGRKPMSQAEKRRWQMRKNIENPDADQYYDNLIFMVYGEQPEIYDESDTRKTIIKYKGTKTGRSLFPLLKETPNMREFLQKLSIFHDAVARMAAEKDIGRGKKESEVFTRACLISFMEYISNLKLFDRSFRPPKPFGFADNPGLMIERAIETFYLGKMTNDDDRNKVRTQLLTSGIFDTQGHCAHVFSE